VYVLQPECCIVLFVTTGCKEIFLFPKTPRSALGPPYRASSLDTAVICRSYSYRGGKLITVVLRLRIIRAVPSLRPSRGVDDSEEAGFFVPVQTGPKAPVFFSLG